MVQLHGMRRAVQILFAVSLVLGLAFLALGLVLWTNPLGVGRWLARTSLPRAGLEETRFPGPRGEIVYFRGGPTGESAKDGRTLVLLHGLGDQAATWGGAAEELARDHRLLVPDLPGHGESGPERGEGPLSLQDALDAVKALVDLEVPPGERVTLVGNSMGGWVALLYALERSERVEELILVSSGGLYTDLEGVSLTPTDQEEARRLVQAVMGPEVAEQIPGFFLTDIVDKVDDGPVPLYRASFDESWLLEGRLDRIRVPAELIWGDEDGLLTLDYARRLEAGLPAARLHVLEGCAHSPQVTCTDRFVRLVEELLHDDLPQV